MVRPPNQKERATGAEPLTQFGRMCATLGITIIPASSPQAKGRIERHHGTHQDRLVKKLRRKGIAELARANAFLEAEYWAEHNQRFAQAPASCDDFHRALPRGLCLDQVFRLEQTRTVSNDWVVRYANRHFQLERQSHHPPARGTVQVLEDAAGSIEIRYRGRRMRWTEITAPIATVPTAAVTIPAPAGPVTGAQPRGQSKDHPWRRQAIETHYAYKQLTKDRRAWQRAQSVRPVEAAGAVDAKSARPPLLGKLQTSFPRASTGRIPTKRGHFY
jgi:hypothetical protein